MSMNTKQKMLRLSRIKESGGSDARFMLVDTYHAHSHRQELLAKLYP
jgi:hypothetical protein